MRRLLSFAAAFALLITGSAVAASPAVAAAPPVTIMHANSLVCLYQAFDGNGAATVNAYFAPRSPCAVYGGNAQWRFEYAGGNNIYRIVNHRWDPRGLWCLSAPNNQFNETVYVELCDPAMPGKQLWLPYVNTLNGMNRLKNIGTDRCLYRSDTEGYRHLPTMISCTVSGGQNDSEDFRWS
ncbi:hypothetical protein ACWEOZ_30210 [Actinoplanes sp. NPDC004185]